MAWCAIMKKVMLSEVNQPLLHSRTKWQSITIDEELLAQLMENLDIHRTIARMLIRRGIKDVKAAQRFLSPQLEDLFDPFLLDGMKPAVERIHRALDQNEKILIYGDYDVDGISSTSLMILLLRQFQADVDYYIPNRFREGYGIHREALQLAKEKNVQLIVSVDTGIRAIEEAAYAKELGLDLIITDHHEPPDQLPDAIVINPKKNTCRYPFKHLAGVGVAFKLATALLGKPPVEFLDLVALGTIADLVPLTGENRILATYGLKRMNQKERIGLCALARVAGIEQEITTSHIGFALGPRLNAAGRLDSADIAVELLITDDPERAEMIAGQCDQFNQQRQQMVQEMTEEAISRVEADPHRYEKAIVVADPAWNEGVVGIVASRLVEQYYRPVVVLGVDQEKGIAKGSARSIESFDLYRALSECEEYLLKFGGHQMAAGMTLRTDQIDLLQQKLSQLAMEWLTPEDWIPSTLTDDHLTLADVNIELIRQLDQLAPYGVGNPVPQFVIHAKIQRKYVVGVHKDTLKLELTADGAQLEAVGFRMGTLAKEITPFAKGQLLGELTINEWNGIQRPQLIIRDMKIPHVQVFDWRSNHRSKWERIHELDAKKCIFFASKTKMELPKKVWIWSEWADQYEMNDREQHPPYLVFVDPPPTLDHFQQVLERLQHAERLYFLHGDADFDSFFVRVPSREQFKLFYQTIYGRKSFSLTRHLSSLQRKTGLSKQMLTFMIQVFEELGFVQVERGELMLRENPPKRSLTESSYYQEQLAKEQVLQRFIYSSYQELCDYIYQQQGGGSVGLQTENTRNPQLPRIGHSV